MGIALERAAAIPGGETEHAVAVEDQRVFGGR
jgi:hypothetical protein